MKLYEVTDEIDPTEERWEPAYKEEAEIKDFVLPILQQKIEKLNTRARKLGLPEIQIHIQEELFKDVQTAGEQKGVTHKEKFYKVKIEGDAPKLAGWQFVARVQHQGEENIIDVVPGEDTPALREFRSTKGERCDHCKTSRYRIDTFIVKNDQGEYKQVGRNCLKDFLGLHKNPQSILWYMSTIASLGDLIRQSEQHAGDKGMRAERYVSVEDVVAAAAEIVSHEGYIKREDPHGRPGTVGEVRRGVLSQPSQYDSPRDKVLRQWAQNPSPQSKQQAQTVIQWFNSLPEETINAEQFYQNVRAMMRNNQVSPRNFGYIVALIPMYARAMNMIKQREQRAAKSNEWLGTVGGTLPPTKVKVIRTNMISGPYGTSQIVSMEDATGNLITWFNSSKNRYEKDQEFTVTGTVKKQDQFHDKKQTVITRAKVTQ